MNFPCCNFLLLNFIIPPCYSTRELLFLNSLFNTCGQLLDCHLVSSLQINSQPLLRSHVLGPLTILEAFFWARSGFSSLNWIEEATDTGKIPWMIALLQTSAFILRWRDSLAVCSHYIVFLIHPLLVWRAGSVHPFPEFASFQITSHYELIFTSCSCFVLVKVTALASCDPWHITTICGPLFQIHNTSGLSCTFGMLAAMLTFSVLVLYIFLRWSQSLVSFMHREWGRLE